MSAPINDGGPAFPIPYGQVMSESGKGMTLRDYFAAVALQGLIAADTDYLQDDKAHARSAYRMANAMLKQREAQP